MELEGQNQTFGKATVHATVLRVQPTQAPQHLAFASQREVGPGQPALVVLVHQHLLPASLLTSLSLQEGGEVHGFTVDLPSSLFLMAKEREDVVEHRVLVMDINSQTMFQVMPMHMAWWDVLAVPGAPVVQGSRDAAQTRMLVLARRRCFKDELEA